ncbi:MAG: cysteine--tRNA ligase [Lachnospiraceae bacterium]|nr:cysteine--tRNA ligase [Lachnospiraceae bacterium]
MRIYNTLTKSKQEFHPIREGKVGMYVCGPTVYNYIHIGNARPMIVFDTVRRYLEYKGYEVNYVSNFTDVDDKIIKKAMEEGVDASEISERYIKECQKDMADLNVKEATHHPKATEEIDGMIAMIQSLIEKGYAYEVNGTVYYRVKRFHGYGKLSHKNLDDMQSGHRDILVTGETEKEDPMDFVLWKPKKEGEPAWDSPWGEGRPGWHIECSVMSKKYVGDTLDIHAGGEDLIFPHHENEIAQSEASNGVPFANYWMHNAFLNIDNKKMSKSAGNFFTVRDIAEKFPLQVLRFFMLSVHYRSPLNFSDTLVQSAKNGLDRILTAVESAKEVLSKLPQGKQAEKPEEESYKQLQALREKFEAAMEDDFNTADAIAAIFEMVKLSNITVDENASYDYAKSVIDEIEQLCGVLGIETEKKEEMLDEEIEAMIEERQQARKNKDFKKADEIRDALLEKGIQLKDTREGVKWSRV